MPRVIRPLYWFIHAFVVATLLRIRYVVRVQRHAAELKRPAILAAKHLSYWDVPLMSRVVLRYWRVIPFFEMGTFEGYAFLGRVRPILRAVGGFEVMRGKDLLRLKARAGGDRQSLRDRMRRVNMAASTARREILLGGGVYCFFPEGARDPDNLRRLRSKTEIEEGILLADEASRDLWVHPVSLRRSTKRVGLLRRRIYFVEIFEAIPLRGCETSKVLADIEGALRTGFEGKDSSAA